MELLFEKYWLNNIIWSRPLKKILLSIVRVYVQYSPFINNFFLVSEFDIQFLHDLPNFFPWFMKRQRDIRLFEMLLSSKLFRFSFYIKMIFFLNLACIKKCYKLYMTLQILVHWKEYLLQYPIKFTSSTYINTHTV